MPTCNLAEVSIIGNFLTNDSDHLSRFNGLNVRLGVLLKQLSPPSPDDFSNDMRLRLHPEAISRWPFAVAAAVVVYPIITFKALEGCSIIVGV